MADYEIRLFTPAGAFVRTLQFRALEYALIENDVGALQLTLQPDVPLSLFGRDAQIEVWRSVNGAPYLEGSAGSGALWLVRRARFDYSGDVTLLTITAYDAKALLKQRHIDGVAGSSIAQKTGALDNIMRAIVRESLGANAGTAAGRNLSSVLTVEADATLAPSATKAFAHRNVLTVLQELALQSAQAGVYLSFDVVHTGRLADGRVQLAFRVFPRQRGVDRGASSPARLVFSRAFGTLTDVAVEYDWTEEINAVKAGGAGEGSARVFATAEDAQRITASPLARAEDFIDRTNINTASVLQSDANASLFEGRPRQRVSGTLLESPNARYGVHFNHGDIVTVQEGDIVSSARLSAVRVVANETGERVEARVNTETVI